jgi:putative phosphoesterase
MGYNTYMTFLHAKKDRIRVGVISDTHGLLRPEAAEALGGVDLIIHAGDIGRDIILDELESLAPIVAVRGNMDSEGRTRRLPLNDTVVLENMMVYVIHDLNGIDLAPRASGISVVISGHSHKPSVRTQDGVLYLNPGSAGPRRFKLPVSIALLHINGKHAKAEIVQLNINGKAGKR